VFGKILLDISNQQVGIGFNGEALDNQSFFLNGDCPSFFMNV
jgi:hypothetical protein